MCVRAAGPHQSPSVVSPVLFHKNKHIFLESPGIMGLMFLGPAAHNKNVRVPTI